jgi:hypothetical protein
MASTETLHRNGIGSQIPTATAGMNARGVRSWLVGSAGQLGLVEARRKAADFVPMLLLEREGQVQFDARQRRQRARRAGLSFSVSAAAAIEGDPADRRKSHRKRYEQ